MYIKIENAIARAISINAAANHYVNFKIKIDLFTSLRRQSKNICGGLNPNQINNFQKKKKKIHAANLKKWPLIMSNNFNKRKLEKPKRDKLPQKFKNPLQTNLY